MLGQHHARARVGCLEHPAESRQDQPQAPTATAQPGGTLVVPLGGGGAHLALNVLDQAAAPVPQEQPQRFVEAPAIEVGIKVAKAR